MSTKIILQEILEKRKKKTKKVFKTSSPIAYAIYRLSKNLGIQPKLEQWFKSLEKYVLGSTIVMSYPVYVALLFWLPLIVAGITFPVVFIITYYVLFLPIPQVLLYTFVSALLAYLLTFILAYIYPIMAYSTRVTDLEKSLVSLYAYLAALGVSGVSYTEAIKKIWERSDVLGAQPELTEVAKRIYILGWDVRDALRSVADITPSRDFANFLRGLANVIESGAGLDDFATIGFETSLADMQAKMKEAINSLELVSEMYVTGAGVMPILALSFAVVIATMGSAGAMFGITLPVPPSTIAGLMAFFGIPLLSILIIVLTDSTLSRIRGW